MTLSLTLDGFAVGVYVHVRDGAPGIDRVVDDLRGHGWRGVELGPPEIGERRLDEILDAQGLGTVHLLKIDGPARIDLGRVRPWVVVTDGRDADWNGRLADHGYVPADLDGIPVQVTRELAQLLEEQLGATLKQLARSEQSVARLHARLLSRGAVIDARNAEIGLLRQTLSWRVTAPLRAVKNLLVDPPPGDRGRLAGAFLQVRDSAGRLVTRLRRKLSPANGRTAPSPSRQLLVDVTHTVTVDNHRGIRRVVHSVLKELLAQPPEGYHVECVYEDSGAYHCARHFVAKLLGRPAPDAPDEEVQVAAGDVFLGLDLSLTIIPARREILEGFAKKGVAMHFVVYDLLPVHHPEWFSANIGDLFERWLRTICELGDGVVCISRSVADEVIEWLEEHPVARLRPLEVGWFHLGSDVEAGPTTTGLARGFEGTLTRMKRRRSVLMVGTAEPRKGYAQALAAFEVLWARGVDANLVIVGQKGWQAEELWRRLDRHPEAGNRLHWVKRAGDEMLVELYRAADGLLAASEGEGFGLPIVEAARHGKPVLARSIPVFREIGGEHASYFSGRGPSDLAEALRSWLDAIEERRVPDSRGMRLLTWTESTRQLSNVVLLRQWYQQWQLRPADNAMKSTLNQGTHA